MELKKLPDALTICKLARPEDADVSKDLFFLCRTDEEISLVCRTEDTRNTHWPGKTAGAPSASRGCWIFR